MRQAQGRHLHSAAAGLRLAGAGRLSDEARLLYARAVGARRYQLDRDTHNDAESLPLVEAASAADHPPAAARPAPPQPLVPMRTELGLNERPGRARQ